MTSAAPGGASSVHFIHDEFGRLIAEHDGTTGAPLREYVWLGWAPVAFVDYSSGLPIAYYVHTDQVMNPLKLTDASGAIVWDRVQDPFGVEVSATGSLTQNIRFPGQAEDDETDLFQNWHRDYDPSLGRYVQSDPIGLMGGINTYAYVGQNPIGNFDVEGESATAVVGGLIAGDAAVPEPSDLAWPKWLGYGGALAGAALIDYALTRPWRKRDRWHVYVRCNVNKQPLCQNCPDTIGGNAFGPTFQEANARAQQDAGANLAANGAVGCQTRHCQPVKCFVNGAKVSCPKSGRQ